AASGSVTGAGIVGNSASVTLTALPAPGFAFTNWTLGGAPAGTNNPVTFDALGNYTFVANFTAVSVPVAPPQLALAQSSPGALALQWPTNATGFVLEKNSDLGPTNWAVSASPITVVGTNYQATIPTQTGSGFFRLSHP
ncbi:MAG: Divergent InlB B-repeat domain, partial [Verrucomicrobiota bacterium]